MIHDAKLPFEDFYNNKTIMHAFCSYRKYIMEFLIRISPVHQPINPNRAVIVHDLAITTLMLYEH